VSLTFNKRLANQWMMRGNFTWNDWTWDVPSSAIVNPQQPIGGGNADGDTVVTCAGSGSGAKAGVCISSSWSYSMSGMYQVAPDRPWGFNVAAALNGHEGCSNAYWLRVNAPASQHLDLNVMATESGRLQERRRTLDLRIESSASTASV
jgi:hypothetical protein